MTQLGETLRRSSDITRSDPEIPMAWFNKALSSKYMRRLGRICQHRGLENPEKEIVLRVDHSIGAARLAYRIVEHQRKVRGVEISDDVLNMAVFFSLSHDLGHGPFSHAFEQCVIPYLGIKHFDHEHYSVAFARELAKEIGLSLPNEEIIEDVISRGAKGSGCQVLGLISNKKFGLDVDRIDYLLRDAAYFGVQPPFTQQECIEAFYFDPSSPELTMMIRKKSLELLNKVLNFRMTMYKEIYYSKNMADFCILITDIFEENASDLNLKTRVLEEEAFFHLDDLLLEEARGLSFNNPNKIFSQECFLRLDEKRSFPLVGILEAPKFVCFNSGELEERLSESSGLSKSEFRLVDVCMSSLKDIDPNFLVFDEEKNLVLKVSDLQDFVLVNETLRRIFVYVIREEMIEKLSDSLKKVSIDFMRPKGFELRTGSK